MPGKKKIALITGISGQDGFYLSKILLLKGFVVYGTTRNKKLKLKNFYQNKIKLFETNYAVNSIKKILTKLKPQFIFNLTGQSYVSKSWDLLHETIYSQGVIVSNLLEAIVETKLKIRFMNMTSAEIFDHKKNQPFHENSPLKPYNPYGCAQVLGHNLVEVYRKTKGVWASNSILFPHESEHRPKEFLFRRIVEEVKKIAAGKQSSLKIGNLDVERDWGYAPVFMEGVFKHSLLKKPTDICFCTGESYKVKDILKKAFLNFDMDYRKYIIIDKSLVRNYEPNKIVGKNSKAKKLLNWYPKFNALDIIDMMLKK